MFPEKKPKGTLGRPIKLNTNHYGLNLKKDFTVYQYDVELLKLFTKTGASKPEEKLVKNKELTR